MNQKELTKTFMIILNWKKTFRLQTFGFLWDLHIYIFEKDKKLSMFFYFLYNVFNVIIFPT